MFFTLAYDYYDTLTEEHKNKVHNTVRRAIASNTGITLTADLRERMFTLCGTIKDKQILEELKKDWKEKVN